MIRDLIRFWWRRDSESATMLIMSLAVHLDCDDAKGMGEYLLALAGLKERNTK